MIPVSLTIKGLYSYQKEQKIDFEKLLEGQLFGIFGAVGSGKSSILEAISYALYGETERLNKTDYRSYNMMNLKSDDLLIDFIFKNHDNINYRFIVRGKRNPKNFEKVNTLERTAYKQENNGWIPLESASGEDIIGLSYDNFRRTIIIPQGKFQEFLQLKEKDRTDMLKEIFSLDRFDFFFQTSALERKNSHAMLDLQGQLKMYAELFPEIIQNQENEVATLQLSLNNLKAELAKKEKSLKDQQGIQQLFNDFDKAKNNLAEIKKEEAKFKVIEDQVKNYEYCFVNFNDHLKRKDAVSLSKEKRKEQYDTLTNELDVLVNDLKNSELSFSEISKHYDKLDDYKDQITDLDLILKIFTLKDEAFILTSRIKDGNSFVDKSLLERDGLKTAVETLSQQLKDKKSAMPDLLELTAIKAWFNGKSYHADALNKAELQLVQQLEILGLFNKEVSAIQQEINYLSPANPIELANYVNEQHQQLLVKQEKVLDLIKHYEVQSKIADLSRSIVNGEPCPLCGSAHHPHVLIAEDVIDHLNIAKQEIEALKKEAVFWNNFSQKIVVLKLKEEELNKQVINHKNIIQEAKNKYEDYLKTFSWQDFKETTEAQLTSLIESTQQLNKDIISIEKSLEETQQKHKAAEDAYQKFKTGIEKIQADLSAKESQTDFLKQQLKQLEFSSLSAVEAINKLQETKDFIVKTQKDYKELKDFIEKARNTQAVLTEKINAVKERIQEEEKELTDLNDNINKCLEKSVYQNIEEVILVLNQDLNLEDLKDKIKNYHQQVYSATVIFESLKKQVDDKEFDEAVFQNQLKEFDILNTEFKAINDEFVKASVKLSEQQKSYKVKLILEKQLQDLELRAADISVLKNMFKANGFISYISTVYLNQLCEAANERFYKLSRQQLRLEITDKNNFEVRDYLNDGRVRSVKTLSGGQTFQASLSLALALAESVQHQNNAQQNFFFLDEGFGSLDKESLQTALETLKSLRKENRIVGVISHVEELQQEIDVFLTVVNDSVEGSQVKGNWE